MRTVFISEGRLLAVDDRVVADLSREELIECLEEVVDQVLALQAVVERGQVTPKELN